MAAHLAVVPAPGTEPPTITEGEHPLTTARRALLLAATLERDNRLRDELLRLADVLRMEGVSSHKRFSNHGQHGR